MVFSGAHDSQHRGTDQMKILSTALLAAGLVALSACGGGGDDAADNNVTADTYNVAPDDLGTDLDNELLGNDTTTNVGADNAATDNTTANVQ